MSYISFIHSDVLYYNFIYNILSFSKKRPIYNDYCYVIIANTLKEKRMRCSCKDYSGHQCSFPPPDDSCSSFIIPSASCNTLDNGLSDDRA